MSAILYPIAPNPERALADPLGRAARESEAAALAHGAVTFATEPAGPAFETYEAAVEAWKGRIDAEGGGAVAPENRFCALREVIVEPPGRTRARPVFKEGRRWSEPPQRPKTAWRLSVSYWRVASKEERAALEQARKVRRKARADIDPDTLRALSQQPLQPVRPQQPLDIGLFEYRPPEAPHIVMPDE